ncbi:CD44 antigen isoform X3 [Carettochelys insculpta]|uniref:CD44 antigen isoform X3 n=1 Tax=Carettochelys insculpta TaxID=44489 RepID=UPI003EBF39E1
MKRSHGLNGPWGLSFTLLLAAEMVISDQNRSMLGKEFNISCRYAGVFHVEKNRRYSLTRSEAIELCRALNSTLPTMEQMHKAHELGFETCRYGYIEDKIVIPRIKPYHLCAANSTGIYILHSNITERYDTYCYNASETRNKTCEPIIRLEVSWAANETEIVIDNEDGSRYTDGVRHTDAPPVTDDDHVGSGSTHDRDTTSPTIIRTHISGTPYYEDLSSRDDGAHEEDSTQDPFTPILSHGGDDSGDKEQHPPSTTVSSHHGAHEESSTERAGNTSPVIWSGSNTGLKEQHPNSSEEDEDSQENDSDDEDDEDSPYNSVHSGWGKNDEKEEHTPVTYVDFHGDPNRIESTQNPLLPNVYLGGDKDEDKYPTNSTMDSVKLEHFSVKERDNFSSVTVNNEIGHNSYTPTVVSHEGVKSEDPTKDPLLNGAYPGWGNEIKYSTNTTRDDVLPGVIPSRGSKHSTTAKVPNDNAKQEGTTHSAPSPADPGWASEDKYPTNTSRNDVLPGLIPPNESGHKDGSTPTAVISTDGAKHGNSSQDPPSFGDQLGWGNEDRYPTDTSKIDVHHGFVPSSEKEQENKSSHTDTAVVSSGGTKYEDSTQDPPLHGVHPGWGNTDKYPMNVTRENVLPGIISPNENDQEKESSHTAVTSNDGAIYEDSTHDSLPPENQPVWGSEDKYHTNISRDYVTHGLVPQNENEYKDESYTAVVSSAGATHEDSTQDPLLHSVHPEWDNEDTYLTNTSRDDVLPGISPPSEIEPENESSHTVVVSNDGIEHEDSTTAGWAPGIQPGEDDDDKYHTNNTRDTLIPGRDFDVEIGHGSEAASTATSATHKYGGRKAYPGHVTTPKPGSQPRSAQIPDWLIIVASLLALALVLAVCIAVNSRRRCGQKKKLVINDNKGSVSDKKMGGLNGEASKSQEMVHLVHKEQSDNQTGSCDEFLTTDETQNQQEADLKTGI